MNPNFQELDQSESDRADLARFALNPQGFLLLSGSNGSGKSYAAEAIYHEVMRRKPTINGIDSIMVTQADMNQQWLDNDIKSDFAKELKRAPLLVIDDVGTRRPTDAFADFLYLIIDYRWRFRNDLGTIITTNLNSKAMREMFGSAIISRVASGIVKRWDSPDRRSKEF